MYFKHNVIKLNLLLVFREWPVFWQDTNCLLTMITYSTIFE